MTKYAYFFGGGHAEGSSLMRNLLGGKGCELAEMTNLGIPVPPGFTITTQAWARYNRAGQRAPEGLWDQVHENLKKLETASGLAFGDGQFRRSAQSDDQVDRQRSRPQPAFLSAADRQRSERRPRPVALADDQRTATIESKTNFFAPIPKGDTARAVCTPLHSGRTTIVLQTNITRGCETVGWLPAVEKNNRWIGPSTVVFLAMWMYAPSWMKPVFSATKGLAL